MVWSGLGGAAASATRAQGPGAHSETADLGTRDPLRGTAGGFERRLHILEVCLMGCPTVLERAANFLGALCNTPRNAGVLGGFSFSAILCPHIL